MRAGWIALLFILGIFSNTHAAERDDIPLVSGKPGKIRLGMAITPENFPNHTPLQLKAAFRKAASLSNFSVFITQWGRARMDVVKLIVEKSRANGLEPILGLSPTLLTGGRKDLDVPDAIRKAAGGKLSFSNPVVRKAFVDMAVKMAELKPAYLCLATEINLLALGNLPEYLAFSQAYKLAYQAIKKTSPSTQVFVSFQWEIARILDAKQPNRLHAHGKLIDIFRPALDLIALTSYPSPHHKTPADLPEDYYSWVYHHVDRSEAIMLMELCRPHFADTTMTGMSRYAAPYRLDAVSRTRWPNW